MTNFTGGCLCGAVRFSTSARPLTTRLCWCRDCQYWAGGNATVNLVFNRADVQLDGLLTDFQSLADSGNPMHREFCAKCGTPVTSASDVRPNLVILRAGTLDDPNMAKPEMIIWTSSAPGWAVLDPGLPHYSEGQT